MFPRYVTAWPFLRMSQWLLCMYATAFAKQIAAEMPGLVRKLVVCAAVDGLILQPLHQRAQRSLKIDYKSHAVSSSTDSASKEDVSLECHGIVGTLAPLADRRRLTDRIQSQVS